MNTRPVRVILLLVISLVSAGLVIVDSPLTSVIPKANAAVPNSSALLGFYSDGRFSQPIGNAIISSSFTAGNFVRFDVNITGGGPLKGFIVNITWANAALTFSNSSFGNYIDGALHYHSNPWCPASQGCLFDGLGASGVLESANATGPLPGNSAISSYTLAVTDVCTISCPSTVPGTGILFRIAFRVAAASQHTTLHFLTSPSCLTNCQPVTEILNPGLVPTQNIDGYFDNNATPVFNYPISVSPTSLTVVRPVSGSTTSPGATLTLGTFTGTGSVSFTVLGLPNSASSLFSPNTACSAACSTSFTVTVNGNATGVKGRTPSGTYTLALVSNATSGSTGMVKVAWLSLVVLPSPPPVWTLAASPNTPKFHQEDGNSTFFTMTATLTSGSNDSITTSNTCSSVQVICAVTPSSGRFLPSTPPGTFTSSLNVTTPIGTPTGVYRFNVTFTTEGTYSEQTISKNVTFTITIAQTHNIKASSESMPRLFSYEGVSLVRPSGHPINMTATFTNQGTSTDSFSVNATARATLSAETPNNITFVDKFGAGFWKPGDTVIHDIDGVALNGSRTYDAGDIIINGTAPSLGTHLITDGNLRWVDKNFDGKWECFSLVGNMCKSGKTVIYDSNGDGVYDKGDILILISGAPALGYEVSCAASVCPALVNVSSLQPNEPIISGSAVNGVTLTSDSKLKFWDLNGTGIYGGGQESVIYDSGNTGTFQPSDPHIKFVDTDFNGVWDCTTSSAGVCTSTTQTEAVIYDAGLTGRYAAGDTVIFGATPAIGRTLLTDPKIRFQDVGNNGVWKSGDPVIYDIDNNGIYEPSVIGELLIAGTAPASGTVLKGDPIISGLAPPAGASIVRDAKVKFIRSDSSTAWDINDSVVYDLNNLGTYFNGQTSITINIDPENAPHGLYTIFVYSLPVAGELNLANTGLGIVSFTQRLRGDVAFACKVNIFSLTSVAGIFGATSSSAGFNIAADLNNDGVINIFDLSLVGGNFGAPC
jgi:hypothetical protein